MSNQRNPKKDQENKDWPKRFAERDRAAFDWAYKQYAPRLKSYIRMLVKDDELTADLLQDSFAGAWRYADRYDESKSSLFTWLATLTRNMVYTTLRLAKSKKRQPEFLVRIDQDELHTLERHYFTFQPDSFILDVETLMVQLSPEQRQVIELVYYQDLTYDEADKAMNVPPWTSKRIGSQALRILKRGLKGN